MYASEMKIHMYPTEGKRVAVVCIHLMTLEIRDDITMLQLWNNA